MVSASGVRPIHMLSSVAISSRKACGFSRSRIEPRGSAPNFALQISRPEKLPTTISLPVVRSPITRELSSSRAQSIDSDQKGKLLTTPSRLFKLVLPLPPSIPPTTTESLDEPSLPRHSGDGQDVAPLAILVHPQQPLSYLERLLQAELPLIEVNGIQKPPAITFWAETYHRVKGRSTKDRTVDSPPASKDDPSNGPVPQQGDRVRWSASTEVGDFVRDAAKVHGFAISIQGLKDEILVKVPSFHERTYYMRSRLRAMSREIEQLAEIKSECDALAHKGADRLAKGGFGILTGWWALVYYTTFHTDSGWDLVEPITYLAGLASIMAGYLWFLYMSRDLSYRSALRLTVSKRQNALYQERGFDIERWGRLVEDANRLRREVRSIADEYETHWDEAADLGGDDVVEVLEKESKEDSSKDDDDHSDREAEKKKKKERSAAKDGQE